MLSKLIKSNDLKNILLCVFQCYTSRTQLAQFFCQSIRIKWYLTVVLVCAFMIVKEVEYIFFCLQATSVFCTLLCPYFFLAWQLLLIYNSSLYILVTKFCQLHLLPIHFDFVACVSLFVIFKKYVYVFLWLLRVLAVAHRLTVAACGVQFLGQGWNLGPLH